MKPLECKRGIASKLNGQLEFTVVIENASDTDQRQFELKKQVIFLLDCVLSFNLTPSFFHHYFLEPT